VGGDTLTLNSTSLLIQNETAWYQSAASGGPDGSTSGISKVFSEPIWQKNTEANKILNGQGRGVPDISAIANNTIVYQTQNGGSMQRLSYGGTSVASPVEAGIVAEMDAVLNHYKQQNLGYLNPIIYKIANEEVSPLTFTGTTGYLQTGVYNSTLPLTAFYDVKYGRNHVYNASFGYDLVTGWGSIDAYNLTMYLLSVNYSGKDFALRGVENTLNLSGLKVTSYLYNTTTKSYSTVNKYFNASIQQNMFVADALGAPIYWIQNVIYINGSSQTGWVMNYTGWVIFPFYGLYPYDTVYQYDYPL
ncbi:Peptidase S53 propeptide, partial [mine drainage metagenome]